MDVLVKARDAASMFWQALDEHERRLVVYVAGYVLCTIMVGLKRVGDERRDQRLRAQILAELQAARGGEQ